MRGVPAAGGPGAAQSGAARPSGRPPGGGVRAPRDLPPGRVEGLGPRDAGFVRHAPAPDGAPTVLLLHGWTVTADTTFAPVYPELAGRFGVVAPDLRGHGRGPVARPGLRLEDLADDAAATLDALGVERAVVAGYSMGGAVAQLLWRRHPDRVAALVLCSTARHFRGSPLLSLWYRGQGLLAPAVRAFPGPARSRLARAVEAKVADGPHAAWLRRELLRNDPSALLRVGAALGRFDSSPWVGTVDVPTAVVVTTDDRVVPTPRQRALAAALGTDAVHEVDGPHNAVMTRTATWLPPFARALAHVTAALA